MADDTALEADRIVAELRRELALRTAERDEALAQLAASGDVLQVINASPGDLAPVFDAMLEKAMRLCSATFGVFATYHDEDYRIVATHGLPPELTEYVNGPIRIHPGSPPDRVRRDEDTLQVADITELSGELRTPGLVAMIELGKARTVVWVALRKDGVAQGFFGAYRQEVRPFSDKQIALLQNFAAQAVIAMENARLITETREALEQQTATAEVLGVINSSPRDLTRVFDTILEKAHSLCEAGHGSLFLAEGDIYYPIAMRGVPEPFAEVLRRGLKGAEALASEPLLRGEPYVHVIDLLRHEHPLARTASRLAGARTLISVPLRQGDALLGYIVATRFEVHPFTDKQIALLQNFAAQAVIAMENARLITETREALEQQTATAEVLGVINSSPGDLAPVFDAMLEKAMRLCEASGGALRSYDGEAFHAAAMRGLPAEFVEATQVVVPDPELALGRIAHGAHIIQVPDLTDPKLSQANAHRRREMVALGGIRTALWVALRKDDALLGVLVLYRDRVQPFTDKQISLVANFAAQAVIAMENARLFDELRERTADLQESLEYQTATSDVLKVISRTEAKLEAALETLVGTAARICAADQGAIHQLHDGSHFVSASFGTNPAYRDYVARNPIAPGRGTAIGWMALEGRVVHIEDVLRDPEYTGSEFQRLAGFRTVLAVPLFREDIVIGSILLTRSRVEPFTDKQIELVRTFADQAVIAIENTRLLTELREALEQQTATAEVLGVINSSPGDLTPVFDAMLEKAMDLCGAAFGALMSYDGETVAAVATRGLPPELADVFRAPITPRRDGDAPYARFLRGEPLLHIVDMAADDVLPSLASRPRALVDIGGARTGLEIPLRKEGALRGSIWLYRKEVRPFTDKEIALLQNFAAQAVIAMENARLLGELRQRTDEVAAINRELEARVAAQVAELERTGKLRRFLAPQLADLIVAQGDESILETHRREIVVVFCDLRGFTAFAERAEPEEVIELLREYHGALGPIIARFEGTLDHYSGDGIMVFFNDPVPTPEPAKRAVEMAAAMREAAQGLLRSWRRLGHDLGFGVGIAQGYATLGQIGFAERMDYTAIGTVCNLAARLCGEARDGQILVSSRVAGAVEESASLEEIGDLSLKGLSQAVVVYNVV